MKTKVLIRSACLVAVLATTSAGTTARAQVPHTFTAGTPAKATEVNANFAYLVQQLAAANAAIAQLSERAVPVGAVMPFAGTTPPAGWLLCDGSAVSRTDYAALFEVLRVTHGSGDLISTFNLPDYRGRFLRGTDNGAGRDPDAASRASMAPDGASGDAVGSVQGQAFASHNHPLTDPGHAHGLWGDQTNGWNAGNPKYDSDRQSTLKPTSTNYTGITIAPAGGSETRPINAYVNYIIKY